MCLARASRARPRYRFLNLEATVRAPWHETVGRRPERMRTTRLSRRVRLAKAGVSSELLGVAPRPRSCCSSGASVWRDGPKVLASRRGCQRLPLLVLLDLVVETGLRRSQSGGHAMLVGSYGRSTIALRCGGPKIGSRSLSRSSPRASKRRCANAPAHVPTSKDRRYASTPRQAATPASAAAPASATAWS
jgi:hypothetical protein